MNEQPSNYDRVKNWLENPAMRDTFARALGGIAVDPWITGALTAVRTNKNVMRAEPLSTTGSLMTIASLGLRLEGPLGQAYLETRWVWNDKSDKEKGGYYETQAGIGYRGLMAIARRDPEVRDIDSIIVHQGDTVAFQRGTDMWLRHSYDATRPLEERGPMASVYAGVRYRDGYYTFDVFPMADVYDLREKILAQSGIHAERTDDGVQYIGTVRFGERRGQTYIVDPKAAGAPPWIAHEIPMIKKTAIRWAAKYWDLSPDMERATQLIAMDEAGQSQGLAQTALSTMPDNLRHQAEQETGTARNPARQAQVSTFRTGQSLKDRMAAEAAASSSAAVQASEVVDAPGESSAPPPVSTDEPVENPPMSEEDKKAALELERVEAAREAKSSK